MAKSELTKLKDKVWEECRRIVRKRYIRPDGTFLCYTCDRVIDSPEKAHTGHFLPSGACGAYLRHNLRNLRIQDFYCNVNLGGNGTEFYKRMLEEVGEDEVAQLFRDKNKVIKADKLFYQGLLEEYKKL